MRDLRVNWSSPVGDEIDFDEGTGGVNMGHLGVEVVAAVALMFDLQQMRADKNHG